MSTEVITSTGSLGPDFNRSEGRAYFNVPERMHSYNELKDLVGDFSSEAMQRGRRRWVVRTVADADTTTEVLANGLPLEARVPLNMINMSHDNLMMFAGNCHRSDIPEWKEVAKYWSEPNGRFTTPLDRIERVVNSGYELITKPETTDDLDLLALWIPFGWDSAGIKEQIKRFQEGNGWFSGVRHNDRLVAACMGEGLQLPGVLIVEGTEYGTHPDYRGKGLCTAAVAGLHAQILQDQPEALIVAEFNMSSRSDVVGRHVGMTLPLVEGMQPENPIQILKRNVAVFDGQPTNDLTPDELGVMRNYYIEAFGDTYPYWRNFIYGILTKQAIDQHYSPADTKKILSAYKH